MLQQRSFADLQKHVIEKYARSTGHSQLSPTTTLATIPQLQSENDVGLFWKGWIRRGHSKVNVDPTAGPGVDICEI